MDDLIFFIYLLKIEAISNYLFKRKFLNQLLLKLPQSKVNIVQNYQNFGQDFTKCHIFVIFFDFEKIVQ